MIEIINTGFGAFVSALVIYSFFTDRPWIDLAVIPAGFAFLIYIIGYKLGTGEFFQAIFVFVVLLGFIGIIVWRWNTESDEKEARTYSREELIIAKRIYAKNQIADPEGFVPPEGTYDDAENSIDYLLGIIDADSKKYKKVQYESKL